MTKWSGGWAAACYGGYMTKLLEQAIAKIRELPAEDQDALAITVTVYSIMCLYLRSIVVSMARVVVPGLPRRLAPRWNGAFSRTDRG